jgi:hypothetical protein
MINPETRTMLQQYADGNVSNRDLAEWLVQAEYDSNMSQGERDTLALLRLVVIEEAEGRRAIEDILNAVAEILASEAPGQIVIVRRTGSATEWQPQTATNITGVASPARHAGI